MDLLLKRWAEEAAAEYQLDERQTEHVREAIVDRWAKFLDISRPTLQPLANEFIEMRMELKPPDPGKVQEWSSRALPAFQRVREELQATQEQVREVLTPLQRAKFELDVLKTRAGLQIAESKLKEWSDGQIDSNDMWEPLPSMRKGRRIDHRAGALDQSASRSTPTPAAPPPDQVAAELSAWEQYVADFVRQYDLDEGQRTAALSCLSELTERAATHRDRHRHQIDLLERQISTHTGAPGEITTIRERLVELYGPIDEMFQELRTRLEALPTAEQRARVARLSAPRTGGDHEPRDSDHHRPTPQPPD